jgi:hypothetical protein
MIIYSADAIIALLAYLDEEDDFYFIDFEDNVKNHPLLMNFGLN